MVLDPKQIGQHVNLPYYSGYRYAAIPGQGIDDKVEVDFYQARPVSLVYHDHCFHLMDIKVKYIFI